MSVLHFFIPLFLSSLWMRLSYLFVNLSTDWNQITIPLWRGIASDMSVTFLLALCCVFLTRLRFIRPRFSLILPLVLCTLYCFMLAGNNEFITANDANLDFFMLDQALDNSFIEGAVLTKSLGLKLLQSLGVFLLLFGLLCTPKSLRLRPFFTLSIAIISVGFLALAPITDTSTSWMQMNALEDNSSSLRYALFDQNFKSLGSGNIPPGYLNYFFTKDLDGVPIIDYPKDKPNILIITLESVGQVHIKDDLMPFLKSLEKKTIFYPNYVISSQVTVNGLYAMFCANSPGFLRPSVGNVKAWKLKELEQHRFCLPQLLDSHGYHTVYMQSADLKFQRKSKLMPMMGFQETLGKYELDAGDTSPWGGDDKMLYNHALEKIETLEESSKPWFMTLMTISTHHPNVVPDDFFVMQDGKKVIQPHLYADLSLQYFLEELEKRGILKDTFVIVTNDEVRKSGKTIRENIDKSQGVLMIITPDKIQKEIDDVFIQTDMFASIADFLGLETDEIPMGRSFFRKYENFRPIFFNNFFSKKVFVYPKAGNILYCNGNERDCTTFNNSDNALFGAEWEETKPFNQGQWLIDAISKRNDDLFPNYWDKTHVSKKNISH